jgi:hypothetical protein
MNVPTMFWLHKIHDSWESVENSWPRWSDCPLSCTLILAWSELKSHVTSSNFSCSFTFVRDIKYNCTQIRKVWFHVHKLNSYVASIILAAHEDTRHALFGIFQFLLITGVLAHYGTHRACFFHLCDRSLLNWILPQHQRSASSGKTLDK